MVLVRKMNIVVGVAYKDIRMKEASLRLTITVILTMQRLLYKSTLMDGPNMVRCLHNVVM